MQVKQHSASGPPQPEPMHFPSGTLAKTRNCDTCRDPTMQERCFWDRHGINILLQGKP